MTITAYKAFDADLSCRGFEYEVGKTYHHDGPVKIRESGFHACLNPLDTLTYYPLFGSRFCIVEIPDTVQRSDLDSIVCGDMITIKAEVEFGDLIEHAAVAIIENASTAATLVDFSRAATALDRSPAATSGDKSPAVTAGDRSPAVTAGNRSPAATAGNRSPAATLGDFSPAATAGNRSRAVTAGNRSPAVTSGNRSRAATSGDKSPAVTAGDRSPAVTSGYDSPAEARGANSAAAALGGAAKARAGSTGGIALAEYDDEGNLVAMFASLVGENGIKPNTWYRLENGKPVETSVEDQK